MKRYALVLICSMLCALEGELTSAIVQAEVIPDAGSILRDQRPQLPKTVPMLPPEEKVASSSAKKADDGVKVMITKFIFKGYEEVLSESELQDLTRDSLGKEQSYADLQRVTQVTTAYLKQKGWFLARAYLPKQDVTSGTVQIEINPGKSDGNVSIKRDKSVRIKECILECIADGTVHTDEPINEQSLAHAVLLMNDLPGISARSSIAPGSETGTSAVLFSVVEGPLLRGFLLGDNYGNRYTGTWRGSVMVGANDPFKYGDQMSLMLTRAEGLMQGRGTYTFPILYEGLKGNLAFTTMNYKLVAELAPSQYTGKSNTFEIGITNPILRSRRSNALTSISYSYKSLLDSQAETVLHDKELQNLTFSGSGDLQDRLLGGGNTNWNASLTSGTYRHSGVTDITLTKTEGYFVHVNFALTRVQRLAERSILNLSWRGQAAISNLDSSEKFTLGGPYGVRAYPVGEGSGDDGHLYSAEYRYKIKTPPTWGDLQASLFYDAGFLKRNRVATTIDPNTATNLNEYWLQGAGVGLNYTFGTNFNLQLCWAHTIGDNAGRTKVTENNSDGKKENNRFWVQGMMYF
ncbi:MAG: ShlB/FhaC/HecB family hemolysin secretion/activation protein [Chlorobium sp.]